MEQCVAYFMNVFQLGPKSCSSLCGSCLKMSRPVWTGNSFRTPWFNCVKRTVFLWRCTSQLTVQRAMFCAAGKWWHGELLVVWDASWKCQIELNLPFCWRRRYLSGRQIRNLRIMYFCLCACMESWTWSISIYLWKYAFVSALRGVVVGSLTVGGSTHC